MKHWWHIDKKENWSKILVKHWWCSEAKKLTSCDGSEPSMCGWTADRNNACKHNEVNNKHKLTGNYCDSFQGSKNSEGPQCRNISQIHKLRQISIKQKYSWSSSCLLFLSRVTAKYNKRVLIWTFSPNLPEVNTIKISHYALETSVINKLHAVWSKYLYVSGWLLRHADDHEVQPVPGVSEEGEPPHTESSGQNFDGCFKRVDGCEDVSV